MFQPVVSPAQLSHLLTSARKASAMTQAELAARIGVSQPRLSKMEAGVGGWSVEQMFNACQALGLELQIRSRTHAQVEVVPAGDNLSTPSSTASTTDW